MKKIILILFIVNTSCFAQLTGDIRNNFLNASKTSCFKSQRMQTTREVPDSTLKKYCACTSTRIADFINNSKLIEIDRGISSLPSNIIGDATEYCRANWKNYSEK